jgi:exodeoxyribonuclease V beta subunit
VHAVWPDIDRFAKDMGALAERDIPSAQRWQGKALADVLATVNAERQQALQALRASWVPRVAALQTWFDVQTTTHKADWNGHKLGRANGQRWLDALTRWARAMSPTDPTQTPEPDEPDLKTGWQRFTPNGLAEARKPGSPDWLVPPEIHALAGLQAELARLPTVAAALRGHAALAVGERVALLKAQAGSFGFQDMLRRLDAALASERGPALRERILARYPVALVDEFQDTSPLQYRIFDRIYRTADNDPGSALLLIGDPKQSIYAFRGADIHSYLRARVATAGRHHVLGINRRSTHAMVQAVNGWFAWAERRDSVNGGLGGGGAFMFRQGSDDPMPFLPVDAHGRAETLVTSAGPVPALTLVHSLDEVRSLEDTRNAFAQHCAEQIVAWLNDPAAGFDTPGKPRRPLRPADIAVLVRTGTEADAVRHALAQRQVPSVYLSDKDSVFRSPEARDLVHWLTAVSQPQNVRTARAGLATGLLGLSLSTLAELATLDEALDAQLDTLRQLHRVWQTRGVLAMLRRTLHVYSLPARWLAQPLGERRLTNLLHLAELLQTASGSCEGEHALIRWLAIQTTDEATPADDQLVRLESDADLVKVVTVHKSKGLEYPVVCLPFATSHRAVEAKGLTHVSLPGDGTDAEREVVLQFGSEEVNTVERERLKEDTRLFYVALTRARHAVWLGFAAVRTGNSNACRTHLSAAGCLTAGLAPLDAPDWLAPLQALVHALPTATPVAPPTLSGRQPTVALVAAAPVDAGFPVTQLRAHTALPPLGEAAPAPHPFEKDWGVGSFSALVRDLASATVAPAAPPALAPFAQPRPADDEPADAPQAPSMTAGASTADTPAAPWHRFVRGAVAGNFLHAQLEWLAGEGFALATQPRLVNGLRSRCQRSAYAAQADDVVTWLTALVQTSLPHVNARLADITTCLPEMAFWLPVDHLPAHTIDTLCQQHLLPGVPRPPLPKRQLHGMLMGFADLVFEHGGRYWVLDYKSNHLGPDGSAYTPEALAHAMAHHRYDVQAALYLLALHRLLAARLGNNYDPEQHLGGAVYLFLRGIDGPTQGVHWVPPSLPLLTALDAALPAAQGVVA